MPTGNLSTTNTAITSRPNTGPNTEQAATARQGSLDHRRVSTQNGGSVASVRESADSATVATPASARTVSLANAPVKPLDWFADQLNGGEGVRQCCFEQLALEGRPSGEALKNDVKTVVDFARAIDKDIGRAAELLAKSYETPLNAGDQEEVNTLLRAGKYNLEQVQRWASAVRGGCQGQPHELEFMAKLQERLADRHMDLADMMCLFDIDQAAPPEEQAVSRADRIDYHLTAADAALKVADGLSVKGLPEDKKQELVDILQDHRAELGQAKEVATGRSSGSDEKSQVVSKEVWRTSFNLTKGKKAGDVIASLHKHWDAKAADASREWLPLAHPEITQERMLQEFVGYRLKRAGVAKKDMPDLRFQFKEAANRVRNERPWEPIEKQLNYAVGGISHRVQSTITPAGAMADRFAEPYPANGNGVCCSDRMQYTHVPNLARTELTDASGTTLFSALRHGVLDAYDISVATLRKLPEQELTKMVTDLLVLPGIGEEGEGTVAQNSGLDNAAPSVDSANASLEARVAAENPYDSIDFPDSDGNDDTARELDMQRQMEQRIAAENPYDSIDFPDSDGNDDTARELDMQRQMEQRIAAENPYDSIDFPDSDGGVGQTAAEVNPAVGGVGQTAAKITPAVGVSREDTDYGIYSRIDKTRKDPEDEAEAAFNKESTDQTPGVTRLDGDDPAVDSISTSSPDEEVPPPLPPRQYLDQELFGQATVTNIDSGTAAAQVATVDAIQGETFDTDKICKLIRTKKSAAEKFASAMRTAASTKMAEELAVATLASDPDKLQAALDGEVVDLNLSSISLLTPDRVRTGPKSNEREMLRRQTEALQSLSGQQKNLQVRDASGDLHTVTVNCKVRTFNFGVNAGAVGRFYRVIPSHTLGWDKLMGWGYAMERNNPELKALLGDPKSNLLGGEVQDKLDALQGEHAVLQSALTSMKRAPQDGITAAIPELERECAAIEQRLTTLHSAAQDAKGIWREGSYNKGGQDPYKMVSRLGVVINAMGETLAFNCKSGKDRTGQLDAELKYLSALNAGRGLKGFPKPGAPATPKLRQMRSDFTLGTGNLEMQRLNTGLVGFKLDTKGVPGLANYIAGPEMEEMYLGGSNYVKS